jgi:hypothetical protein
MRRQLAPLLVVIATACGSDSSVAPNNQNDPNNPNAPQATLEQALAELTLPVLATAGGSVAATIPVGLGLGTGRCAYTAASQSFVCPPATASGITITQSFTLLTAAGAKQSAFDHRATASVKTNTTVAGTVVEDGATLTIDSQQELTLSGLLAGPHAIDGTSTARLTGSFLDDAPIDIRITGSISSLVLPQSTATGAQVWPTAGTIVVASSGTFGDLPPFTSRVTITFKGTSTVTLTIVENGVSQTCQYDLARSGPPACA